MAYYHSFAWPLYKAPLERAVKEDPSCGMAHWARALSMLDNPFLWPGILSPKVWVTLRRRRAARAAGLKTPRERDYVEAWRCSSRTVTSSITARGPRRSRRRCGGGEPLPEDREATISMGSSCRRTSIRPTRSTPISSAPPDARADLRKAAGSSARRPLPDPQLRLPADRVARARGRQALLEDRARCDTRAADALAYLHARRILAGIGGVEPCSLPGSPATRHSQAACV